MPDQTGADTSVCDANDPQLCHSDQQWEQRIVAELDSGLNKWATSLPGHLRWNPEQENVEFLTQAATLNAFYNFCQMAVHRNFLSSSRLGRESALSLPSAIICTNAARSSIQALEVLYSRTGSPNHRNFGMLFLSGMILVTNAFGLKRSGGVANVEKDLELASKAVIMMRSLQHETHVSGPLAELLNDLISTINEPLSSGARTSGTAQLPSTEKTETGRPRSPIALSPERPLREEATEGDGTPSVPITSARSGAPIHIPPILDFLQPDHPFFSLPFRADGLEPHAQGFVAPFDHLTQRDTVDHAPPPSALPEPHEYDFLPRYNSRQAEPSSDVPASTNQGLQAQYLFDMAGGHTFGQGPEEALLYGDSSSVLAPSGSQARTNDYNQPRQHQVGMAMGAGGDHEYFAIPHFGLMNDAWTMWQNFPPSAGGADWDVANNMGAPDY